MQNTPAQQFRPNRRAFIRGGTLFLLGGGIAINGGCDLKEPMPSDQLVNNRPNFTFGMLTDIHHADKDPAGTRFYRESIGKLQEAVEHFQASKPQFVVALGDVIDAANEIETEQKYLKRVSELLNSAPGENHYVLGNHCVSKLTKQEFLNGVGQEKSYYSFDAGGFHFVILDACFREDGEPYGRNNSKWTDSNIPETQLEWLAEDLASTGLKTIVFVHQRLDETEKHSVKNASDVRAILEQSKKVQVVFQGHSHQNSVQEIAGIHYCVLAAMIEGTGVECNGYATVEILKDDTVCVRGFRKQADYDWHA